MGKDNARQLGKLDFGLIELPLQVLSLLLNQFPSPFSSGRPTFYRVQLYGLLIQAGLGNLIQGPLPYGSVGQPRTITEMIGKISVIRVLALIKLENGE